jgi:molybdopterin converting factor subunit 1
VTFCLWGEEAFRVFAGELARHELAHDHLAHDQLAPPAMTPPRPQVVVRVLLFASAREAAGSERAVVTVDAPATAGDVLDALLRRYPALEGHRASLRLAVNSEYAALSHPMADGDEMALIPPTCGG